MPKKCIRPGRLCQHCVYVMNCEDKKATAGRIKYLGKQIKPLKGRKKVRSR